jgi:hypothetical protein
VIVFCRFFTWAALGDVELCSSSGFNFQFTLKGKLHKKKSCKTRPACTAEFKFSGNDGLILQFVSRYSDNASIIFHQQQMF